MSSSHRSCKSRKRQRECALCRKEGDDPTHGVILDAQNDFVGPWRGEERGSWLWCHRECALWAPKVYQAPKTKFFVNVVKEIGRARKLRCVSCGKSGAVVGCSIHSCQQVFHLPCAREAHCFMNRRRYRMLCPDHYHERLLQSMKKKHKGVHRIRTSTKIWQLLMDEQGTVPMPWEGGKSSVPHNHRSKQENRMVATVQPMGGGGPGQEQQVKVPEPVQVDASITFDRVGGLDDVVHALKETLIVPLLYPELFAKLHISPPRGVLLHGPPGTGKTLLARALANACPGQKIAFFSRKGADILNKFYGDSEKQLRMLFEKAREVAPSIIFFDEIDGLVPTRSSRRNQVHASVVTTLLSLMDGVDDRGDVFVVGATNHVDGIDPALRRPGRFDRELFVGLPDADARAAILSIHTTQWLPQPPSPQVLQRVASKTVNFCGADLRAVCVEAVLRAARRECPELMSLSDEQSLSRVSVRRMLFRVAVAEHDFDAALEIVGPSGARSGMGNGIMGQPLSTVELPHLSATLHSALCCIDPGMAVHKDDGVTVDVHELARVLLDNGGGRLARAVLHRLGRVRVVDIDLASLRSQAMSAEEALVKGIGSLVGPDRSVANVLWWPHVDLWWATASARLKACLVSCLAQVEVACQSAAHKVVVLASSDSRWSSALLYELDMPQEVVSLFRSHVCSVPS